MGDLDQARLDIGSGLHTIKKKERQRQKESGRKKGMKREREGGASRLQADIEELITNNPQSSKSPIIQYFKLSTSNFRLRLKSRRRLLF